MKISKCMGKNTKLLIKRKKEGEGIWGGLQKLEGTKNQYGGNGL